MHIGGVAVSNKMAQSVRFIKRHDLSKDLSSTDEEEEILIDEESEPQDDEEDRPVVSSDSSAKLTCYMFNLVSFAIIGGFLFGYDTGVISGALLVLDHDFKYSLSALQKELIVSVTIAAAAVGAILGGPINELLGRRPTIMVSSVVFSVGAVLMSVAPINNNGWIMILVGRLIVGIGIGMASMTVPMYLAECSPTRYRGRLTVLDNAAVTCGQFVAGVVDFIFSYVPEGWRYMLGVAAFPSLIRLVAFFFLCESPRWLLGRGKTVKAKKVLRKLRGSNVTEASIDKELVDIYLNINNSSAQNEKNFFQKIWIILTHRHLLSALIVGCGLQAIQQLSGINTVMYYSPTIMRMAGASDDHLAIGLGAVIAFGNFVLTLVGLYFIEKAGRRKLILASLTGVIISLGVLAIAFFFTNSTSQVACPTSECNANTCDDCVIQDSCFYCMFPYNASYSHQSIGYCIDRSTVLGSADSCWVNEHNVMDYGINGSCLDSSYITNNSLLPMNHSALYQGRTVSSCVNKFSWLAMIALIMYIISFAPGMGPVPWTVNAEIYPNWCRSIGNSASATTNWICNLLISLTFLHMTRYLTRYGAFSFYALLALCGLCFILLFLPETKGHTLEEVEELFKGSLCPPPGISKRKRIDMN